MKLKSLIAMLITCIIALATGVSLRADGFSRIYEVTVTNITRSQVFTPILVAAHRRGEPIFVLGEPAAPVWNTYLAESGDRSVIGRLVALR